MSQVEIISPEGVEERLVEEWLFRITLTGGGKYRVYSGSTAKPLPMDVHETLKLAREDLARGMALHGALVLHPEKILDILLKSSGPDKAP
jgi:hypothetical protein